MPLTTANSERKGFCKLCKTKHETRKDRVRCSILVPEKGEPFVLCSICGFVNSHMKECFILKLPLCEEKEMSPLQDANTGHRLLKFFEYDHLPPKLKRVSERFHALAYFISQRCPGDEGTIALRKLLEAKDAAVRSQL